MIAIREFFADHPAYSALLLFACVCVLVGNWKPLTWLFKRSPRRKATLHGPDQQLSISPDGKLIVDTSYGELVITGPTVTQCDRPNEKILDYYDLAWYGEITNEPINKNLHAKQ